MGTDGIAVRRQITRHTVVTMKTRASLLAGILLPGLLSQMTRQGLGFRLHFELRFLHPEKGIALRQPIPETSSCNNVGQLLESKGPFSELMLVYQEKTTVTPFCSMAAQFF